MAVKFLVFMFCLHCISFFEFASGAPNRKFSKFGLVYRNVIQTQAKIPYPNTFQTTEVVLQSDTLRLGNMGGADTLFEGAGEKNGGTIRHESYSIVPLEYSYNTPPKGGPDSGVHTVSISNLRTTSGVLYARLHLKKNDVNSISLEITATPTLTPPTQILTETYFGEESQEDNGSTTVSSRDVGPSSMPWTLSQLYHGVQINQGMSLFTSWNYLGSKPYAVYDQTNVIARSSNAVITEHITLTLIAYRLPKIDSVEDDYENDVIDDQEGNVISEHEGIFLDSVSLKNAFRSHIQWQGIEPGERKVTYTLNGTSVDIPASSDVVEHVYDMGREFKSSYLGGDNSLTVKAGTSDAENVINELHPLVVPVPDWAGPASMFVGTSDGRYLRKEPVLWPVPAIEFSRSINPSIPVLGGKWGLANGQLKVGVTSNIRSEPVEDFFTGGFDILFGNRLGSKHFNLASGTDRTTLKLGTSLSLTATFNQPLPAFFFHPRYSLAQLIPGASTVCSVPLVNNVCRAVESIAGVGIEVNGGISNSISGHFSSTIPKLQWDDAALISKLWVTFWAGIDPLHLAGVNVTGQGTATTTFDILNSSLSFSGQLTFQVTGHVLWVEGSSDPYRWEIGRAKHPRDEIASNTKFSSQDSSSTVLAMSQPNDAFASLASGPNGLRAVAWARIDSATDRTSGDIVLRVYDGKKWLPTMDVSKDVQVDQHPAIAFDKKGNILLVWERSESVDIPTEIDSIFSFFPSFDLEYAVIDPLKSAMVDHGALGSPTSCDIYPKVVKGTDQSVMLAWREVDSSNIYGAKNHPLRINVMSWDGTVWSAKHTVLQTESAILDNDLAVLDDKNALLTWTRDTDGDFATSSDREVVIAELKSGLWQDQRVLTSNTLADWSPRVTYTYDRKPVVVWLQEQSLVGLVGNLDTTINVLIPDSLAAHWGMTDGQLLSSAKGLELIWSNGRGISHTFSQLGDQLHWTSPSTLYQTDSSCVFNAKCVISGDSIEFVASELAVNDDGSIPKLSSIICNKRAFGTQELTGVAENSPDLGTLPHVSVKPTPSSSFVCVKSTQVIQNIKVLDLIGNLLELPLQRVDECNYTVDVTGCLNGYYLLYVTTTTGVSLVPLVVER